MLVLLSLRRRHHFSFMIFMNTHTDVFTAGLLCNERTQGPLWFQYPSVTPSAHCDSNGSSGSGGQGAAFGCRIIDGSRWPHHNTDCGQPILTLCQFTNENHKHFCTLWIWKLNFFLNLVIAKRFYFFLLLTFFSIFPTPLLLLLNHFEHFVLTLVHFW